MIDVLRSKASPPAKVAILIAAGQGGMVLLSDLVSKYGFNLSEAQEGFDEAQILLMGRIIHTYPRALELPGDFVNEFYA